MARRRRRRKSRNMTAWGIGGCAVLAVWWWYSGEDTAESTAPADVVALADAVSPMRVALRSDRPELPGAPLDPGVLEKGDHTSATDDEAGVSAVSDRAAALLDSGQQAFAREDWLTARQHLNEALKLGVEPSELTRLRADLTRIAHATIFSSRILAGDPLVEAYVVKTGDTLGKIAKGLEVSDDLLARVNGIQNKNMIHIGQRLKVVRGPFRAVVRKKSYSLDIYLGDTFILRYKVGLGEDDSTPRGEWRVQNKLKNPTYYPPRGGKIIGADNPKNPLGERWVGLAGVEGETLGLLRYGIHGTIEPQSIGKSLSLGCIRMYNEDVEFVYDLLVEKHSIVTIQ